MNSRDHGRATNIRRNTLVVAVANLISRITGLIREIVFAAAFGASAAADAFNAAFRVGNLFRELFAEGALASAFVPLYADVEEKDGEASAFDLANAFLGVLLIAVGAATLLILIAAKPLVLALAGGFAEDPIKLGLATGLARVLSPFVALIAIASVFMGMLNVRGRFFLPAIVPIFFNGFVIAACLGRDLFQEFTGIQPIYGVAIAALLGGAVQAGALLPRLRRMGYRFRPRIGKHPALKRLLQFLVPALIAISIVQINLLIETQIASREGDGPVSWLIYSFRVAHLPFSIVAGAVGVATLAGLSVLRAQGLHDEYRSALARALNLNTLFLLPAAVLLFVFPEAIVELLFERGAFTPEDTMRTAELLRMYGLALLGIGAHRILVPIFYTLEDPWTPMWAGLATVAVKFPVAWFLVYQLDLGVAGLPLSHALLVSLEIIVLVAILHRRVPGVIALIAKTHIQIAIACLALGAVLWPLRDSVSGIFIFPVFAGAGVFYVVISILIGNQEAKEIAGKVLRR
jgi:putative peptidoglycan lipid II flippase